MEVFREWRRDAEFDQHDLLARVERLGTDLFVEYEPTHGISKFEDRLVQWIESVDTDHDRQLLFQLLDHIYFIGKREFDVLYEMAFRTHTFWWLAENSPPLDSGGFSDHINEQLARTWFCPITDSMEIARFHHINHISGNEFRPDWRALKKFGDQDKVGEYIAENGIENVVLLEDFVGSGTQVAGALDFAATVSETARILVLPLIICPAGKRKLAEQVAAYGDRISLATCVEIPEVALLNQQVNPGEPLVFGPLRDLLERMEVIVGYPSTRAEERRFGFRGTGSIAVMHTNCPNNTLPVIHAESNTWNPLFPRSSRS